MKKRFRNFIYVHKKPSFSQDDQIKTLLCLNTWNKKKKKIVKINLHLSQQLAEQKRPDLTV